MQTLVVIQVINRYQLSVTPQYFKNASNSGLYLGNFTKDNQREFFYK